MIARSNEDLGALRIFDPDFPERVVVAAGAPWFMTVFGRDSLLTAWMALLVDPDLALGVLQTLARFQGNEVDPRHDEEPGRILHEMRFGDAASLSLGGGSIYYGTADATPLFVMLLGELRRWGVAREMVDELLPNADRAIEWIEQFGDADGDGYVEYHRATDRGLANQGWKDSWDGIRYADGRVAEAPDRPVRGPGLHLRGLPGQRPLRLRGGGHRHLRPLPGQGGAAEGGVQPRLLAGGQGVVRRRARRRQAAHRLAHLQHRPLPVDRDRRRGQGPSGGRRRWCRRPCSAAGACARCPRDSGGYNPISYHCGSVWPHDTAIVAAGLARYGFDGAAQTLIFALIDAAVGPGRAAARAVQRSGPRRAGRAGRLPDLVLAPGLGGGVAAAVPADPAAPRSVGPLRQDLAVPRTCPSGSATSRWRESPWPGRG